MIDEQVITEARMLPGLSLWLRFEDGYEGIVDLNEDAQLGILRIIAEQPDDFAITEEGRAIAWTGPTGNTIDFSADSFRLRAVDRSAQAAE